MPSRHQLLLPEQTAESLAKLNHYQILGLTEAASSESIERSLLVDRWPWHLVDEEARQVATRMRVEARGVLLKPWSRARYDREKGFTLRHIAEVIGDDASWWATAWVASWSVLALLALVAGPVLAARILGSALAPGYDEIAVYNPPVAQCLNCRGFYSREFISSSGFFHWLLNSIYLWALFPALALTIGMALRTAAARGCGFAVAFERRYASDSWGRTLCLFAVVTVPLAALIAVLMIEPAGTYIPGE